MVWSIDVAAIALGYAAFALTAWRTMPLRGLARRRGVLALVPLYWGAMSWAAWRALFQMHTAPSLWEKTPHGPDA